MIVSGRKGSSRRCVCTRAQDLAGRELQTSHLRAGLRMEVRSGQVSLVVLHMLDELADGVVGGVYLVVLGGEGLEEEGGEGDGGDVPGGEAEDLYDLPARIELGELCPLEGCFSSV